MYLHSNILVSAVIGKQLKAEVVQKICRGFVGFYGELPISAFASF